MYTWTRLFSEVYQWNARYFEETSMRDMLKKGVWGSSPKIILKTVIYWLSGEFLLLLSVCWFVWNVSVGHTGKFGFGTVKRKVVYIFILNVSHALLWSFSAFFSVSHISHRWINWSLWSYTNNAYCTALAYSTCLVLALPSILTHLIYIHSTSLQPQLQLQKCTSQKQPFLSRLWSPMLLLRLQQRLQVASLLLVTHKMFSMHVWVRRRRSLGRVKLPIIFVCARVGMQFWRMFPLLFSVLRVFLFPLQYNWSGT